jgi:hypothetical protein
MVCKGPVTVLTLEKSKFEKLLRYYNELVLQEKIDFLKQYSFFQGIASAKLLSILHYMSLEKVHRNSTIYKEG